MMMWDRRLTLSLVGVALVGVLATVSVAVVFLESSSQALQLGLVSGGVAILAGLLGAGVIWLLRHQPLGGQVVIVAFTAIMAVGAGAWAAARFMLVSDSDLSALAVILVASGTGAAVVAVLLADRFRRESRFLLERTDRIASGEEPAPPVPRTRELASVAKSLDAATDRLAEARRRQERLEASRRQLVADISHDLRTPMAKVRALTEALEDGVIQDPERVQEAYRRLRREMDHLTGLVDDLFELSRAQAHLALEPETVGLGDMVSDSLASVRALAEREGVALAGEAQDNPVVDVSGRDLSRVLDNLLVNAIRHTHRGGTVTVTAHRDDGRARVHVDDECGGIPEPELPYLFEVAYTGDQSRAGDEDRRSGLGLAIARGLTRLYGGDVTVANHGPGCRFQVDLPVHEEAG